MYMALYAYSISVADPEGFHWFPRKPPFKLALIFIIQSCINQLQLLKTYFVLLYIHFLIN